MTRRRWFAVIVGAVVAAASWLALFRSTGSTVAEPTPSGCSLLEFRPRWPAAVPMVVRLSSQASLDRTAFATLPDSVGFLASNLDQAMELHIPLYWDRRRHRNYRFWEDNALVLGVAPSEGVVPVVRTAYYDSLRALLRTEVCTLPVTFVSNITDVITPLARPEVDRTLQKYGTIEIDIGADRSLISFVCNSTNLALPLPCITYAVDITISSDTQVLARAALWWGEDQGQHVSSPKALLEPTACGSELRSRSQSERLTVTLRSNPEMALRNFRCDTFWNGTIVVSGENLLIR